MSAALERYLQEVVRWGSRINLVGSTERAAVERHLADSLAAAPFLPRGRRIVDLGSGAGFPGVPLAIARPDLDVTLVEIRERRVHFLRHIRRTLGLPVQILRQRMETPPPAEFDFALLRAVAPLGRSAALGRPWLGEAGEVWVWSGGDAKAPESLGRIPLRTGGCIWRMA